MRDSDALQVLHPNQQKYRPLHRICLLMGGHGIVYIGLIGEQVC
jgi:hypothetical protein